ncbi:MAG: T9SS type A sorting domain-containing protein, partial [Reichenbachiella sp.]
EDAIVDDLFVGTLSSLDEDLTDQGFVYALTTPSEIFEIAENELWIQEGKLDLVGESNSVTIESTDVGGFSFSKTFELSNLVTVLNLDAAQLSFKIYPNPFTNELHINSKSVVKLWIFDLSGNQLMELEYGGATIDTSKLPAGMYVVRVFTNAAFTDLKLIKN